VSDRVDIEGLRCTHCEHLMYQEQPVKFCCPECGHDTLLRVRKEVTIKESVTAVAIGPSSKPGASEKSKTYSILTGWDGADEGSVDHYECGACRFVLRGKADPYWDKHSMWGKHPKPHPIKSAKQLHDWFKRNAKENADKASSTC